LPQLAPIRRNQSRAEAEETEADGETKRTKDKDKDNEEEEEDNKEEEVTNLLLTTANTASVNQPLSGSTIAKEEEAKEDAGTVLAAVTLLLVCFKALSFVSGLLARCLAAHRIWGCHFHLLGAVLPSVLQWMAIQLGLRGVWPAIQGDDPADHKVESFLTHARRSMMKDRISKKDHKKRENYRDGGSLEELGALGARRKEPTGCDSIIEMHQAESFRIPNSFKSAARPNT
jgi:hypothetical protein